LEAVFAFVAKKIGNIATKAGNALLSFFSSGNPFGGP
jgi:hypothetical protein